MARHSHVLRSLTGLGLSGLALGASAQAPPTADPFAKPVTLEVQSVTVREALKQLGKAAGVSLGPRDALGDLKVTVLVKDEPLGNVMMRIGELFHAEWAPSGTGGYDLTVSPKWNNSLDAYVARENENRRKEAETKVKKLVAGASIPYSQVIASLHSDQSNLTPDQKDQLDAVSTPEEYLLGVTFAQMSGSDMADFWNGRVVRASDTLSPAQAGGVTNLPPNLPGPPIRRRGQPMMGRVVRAMAYYDPITGQLETGGAGRGRLQRAAGGPLIDHPYPTGPLAETPFGKDVLAWNRIETDSPRLQAQIQAGMFKGSYSGGGLSMADAMAWLHKQSGVPIVADSFRTPVKLPRRGGSIANWLSGFQEENSAFVRTEQGFVMLRHGGFWRLRLYEAPEDALAALEASPSPSLDQYATFAASLNRAQMLPFRIKGAALLKVDPEPLTDGMAALRFYASLPADARRVALAGTALPFMQLGARSQTLFMDALENPVGGLPMGTGVPEGNPDTVERQLGFLITPSAVVHPGPPIPGTSPTPMTGFDMLFGTSQNAGVQYLIPLDH